MSTKGNSALLRFLRVETPCVRVTTVPVPVLYRYRTYLYASTDVLSIRSPPYVRYGTYRSHLPVRVRTPSSSKSLSTFVVRRTYSQAKVHTVNKTIHYTVQPVTVYKCTCTVLTVENGHNADNSRCTQNSKLYSTSARSTRFRPFRQPRPQM